MKKNVAVLFGGHSSEYEVSLMSASAVIAAIDRTQYDLTTIGITREGRWLAYEGPVEDIRADRWQQHPGCTPVLVDPAHGSRRLWLMKPAGLQALAVDIAFPVLHGRHGEDGTLQGLFEVAGIPCVGCGCLSSALCMDKAMAHGLALQAGIPCPVFTTVTARQARQLGTGALARKVLEDMGAIPFPWFVKPAAEGSSYGVHRVAGAEGLAPALEDALRYGGKVVVEQGIDGFEVGCAILDDGGADGEPLVGAVDAIALQGGFFDYHEKYNLETAQILLPAPVAPEVAEAIKATALRLYRLLGCSGYARVDLFLSEAGEIIFNEINTIPGMTEHSRFPGMLKQVGVGFEAMVEKLLKGAEHT